MTKEILPGIKYIGAEDYDLDLFESQYPTPAGMTYNSYLVEGEKTAVLDTTDGRTAKQWLDNLHEALKGRKPDYLVIEHLEPDHSTLISTFCELYPEAQLVMSAKAAQMLPLYFEDEPASLSVKSVTEGDELDLGGKTLRFIAAPMVHWPEVMMVYVPEDKVLFSADAFGTFGTLDRQEDDWACEARRYYFNIVGKYGMQVQSVLKKLSALDIKYICPLHGPVLESNLSYYLGLYDTWSAYRPESEGVFIACASIHGNTRKAADYLAERLKEAGVAKVAVADLTRDMMSEAVEDAFRYPTMVVCASSYDAGLFTPMHTFLHTLEAKGYRNRRVAIIENGSWAPSAARVMTQMLSQMKEISFIGHPLTIRGAFKQADRPALDALADAVAAAGE